jgi:hypothetical protein
MGDVGVIEVVGATDPGDIAKATISQNTTIVGVN